MKATSAFVTSPHAPRTLLPTSRDALVPNALGTVSSHGINTAAELTNPAEERHA